jgi:hypothetical protein
MLIRGQLQSAFRIQQSALHSSRDERHELVTAHADRAAHRLVRSRDPMFRERLDSCARGRVVAVDQRLVHVEDRGGVTRTGAQ